MTGISKNQYSNRVVIITIFSLILLLLLVGEIVYKLPLRATLSFMIGFSYLAATILILENDLSQLNIFFSIFPFFLCLGTIMAGFGYLSILPFITWPLGTSLIIIAPLGMIITVKLILAEFKGWLDKDIVIFPSLIIFLAIINLIIYDPNQSPINVYYGDGIIIFQLILVILYLNELRLAFPTGEQEIRYFIYGFIFGIIGLSVNIIIIIIFGEGTIIRHALGFFGTLYITKYIYDLDPKVLKPPLPILPEYYSLKLLTEAIDSLNRRQEVKLLENPNTIDITTESTSIQDVIESNFDKELFFDLNGLTISILIEIALKSPSGISNSNLQVLFKKSKNSLSHHLHKLQTLGLITKTMDMNDIRKTPFLITNTGLQFLKSINVYLSSILIED